MIDDSECYVLRKGEIDPAQPTLVRVHNSSVFDDLLGRPGPQCQALQRAMTTIGDHGAGLIIIFPFPRSQSPGSSSGSIAAEREIDPQTYGIGAQVLAELKVNKAILVTDSPAPKLVGLDAFDVSIVGTCPLGGPRTGFVRTRGRRRA